MKRSRRVLVLLAVAAAALVHGTGRTAAPAGTRFVVSYPARHGAGPFDGRVLLLVSADESKEPRLLISDTSLQSQQVFGVDVDGWKPGQEAGVDGVLPGHPAAKLADGKPGTYSVQALLHKYETFRRADGHVVKLPMDRGEGQQWSRAPGNLFSTPRKIAIDPGKDEVFRIELD